ncbi:hypothetical protein D3C83_322310 [compost metagenome]
MGLRRVLVTQTKRLRWLAERRFENLGGEGLVEAGPEDEEEDSTGGETQDTEE